MSDEMCNPALRALLLLWEDTRIKEIHERKHLARGWLTVSDGESITIMAGITAAGKQASCWKITWKLHILIHRQQAK